MSQELNSPKQTFPLANSFILLYLTTHNARKPDVILRLQLLTVETPGCHYSYLRIMPHLIHRKFCGYFLAFASPYSIQFAKSSTGILVERSPS